MPSSASRPASDSASGQRELPAYVGTVEAFGADRGGAELAPLDAERALHTATLLADGRILVVGGEGTGGPYRRTTLLYTA